ncbi:MAG TPA: hypothetical protein VMT37_09955 [Solirubrobacterales bacterium]|nr:hypothetical protein [Solirubrobacterales bacterium]
MTPALLRRAYKEIPARSEAFPARRRFAVKLRPGGKAVAPAAYGTIRSASVKTLRSRVISVVGDAQNPRAIILPRGAAARIAVGSILAQAPSRLLPHGLFHRVKKKSAHGGHGVLSLAPASLWDAFPALDLETTVPLGESVTPQGAARASGLSSIDLGLGRDVIQRKLAASCGAPPSGWSFAPSGSIQPSLRVEIHRHYLVVPYGELSLSVKGSLGLDATIPKGAHCGFTLTGPGLEGFVPVAGVPVPVEGGVNLSVSIESGGPIQAKADLGLDATGGMSFDGPSTKPIADFQPKASGSVTGADGEFDLGPEFQVGIGVLDGNAHVGVSPGLAAKGSSSGCELDFKGSVGAGIDAGGWHPSVNSPPLTKTLYHCPAKPSDGGGGAPPGGGTPGGGSSAGSWTIESVPAPSAQYAALAGVSCPTTGLCMAVGRSESEALIERRGAGGWSIEAGASSPGAEGESLYGASCVSATSCFAVGGQRHGGSETPLIEHWNGSQWSYMPGPAAPGEYTDLAGISCVDEAWCMAVGQANFSDGDSVEVVEHWNGSSWTLESPPSPPSSDARSLSGVDCTSRSFCEVVGGYDNDQGIFTGHAYAIAWSGTSWALQTVIGPASSQFSGLAGVDCASSSYCAAVGYYDEGLGTKALPMAVGWSGGSNWSNQGLPGLGSPDLGGETPQVSCSSLSSCIAVGRYGGDSGGGALAEHWDGSAWASQSPPAVPGAYLTDLEDVSCLAATSCVAVGDSWSSGSGPQLPLVEVYSG